MSTLCDEQTQAQICTSKSGSPPCASWFFKPLHKHHGLSGRWLSMPVVRTSGQWRLCPWQHQLPYLHQRGLLVSMVRIPWKIYIYIYIFPYIFPTYPPIYFPYIFPKYFPICPYIFPYISPKGSPMIPHSYLLWEALYIMYSLSLGVAQ